MSELKWKWAYGPYLDPPEGQKESAIKAGYVKVVSKQSADEAIAELKQDIKYKEGVGKRWFERCMEARSLWVKNTRALWLARANSAEGQFSYWCARFAVESGFTKTDIRGYSVNTKRILRTIGEWIEMWKNVKIKCRAKAEEYK